MQSETTLKTILHNSYTGNFRDILSPNINGLDKSKDLERVKGIEPSSLAWEAKALPLSYTRDGVPIIGACALVEPPAWCAAIQETL
jgi:hypothetical protein